MINISPFNNPGVIRKQKVMASASFKSFNAVASRLMAELSRIYPNDAFVKIISNELSRIEKDKRSVRTGATLFFQEIRKQARRRDGSVCQYVDLLSEHSDDAFAKPIPVDILDKTGLSEKWAKMDVELKNAFWEYVDRLVHLSAQAVFSNSSAKDEMNELSRAVVGAAISGQCPTPQDLVSDPKVREAADKFVDTVK